MEELAKVWPRHSLFDIVIVMKRKLRRSQARIFLMALMGFFIMAPMVVGLPFGAWPEKTLLVFDQHSGHREKIAEAMWVWNKSQDAVKIKFTAQKEEANVVVQSVKNHKQLNELCKPLKKINPFSSKKNFLACVDWQGFKIAGQTQMGLLQDNTTTAVIVHEFGHVLGIGHTHDRCSIMVPSFEENVEHACNIQFSQSSDCSSGAKCIRKTSIFRNCGPSDNDLKRLKLVYPGVKTRKSPLCRVDIFTDKLDPKLLRFKLGLSTKDSQRYAKLYVKYIKAQSVADTQRYSKKMYLIKQKNSPS